MTYLLSSDNSGDFISAITSARSQLVNPDWVDIPLIVECAQISLQANEPSLSRSICDRVDRRSTKMDFFSGLLG